MPSDQEALSEVTALLRDLAGRADGLPRLFERMQDDLRRVARRERHALHAGETLSTTALVNEAFLKLERSGLPAFTDRRHFYGIAGRAMRQVLVDYARARISQKRGGGETHETLGTCTVAADADNEERVLEINEALDRPEAARPRLAQVVHLRYYAGLTDREIGSLLGVEESTVRRDWLKARGWLFQTLASS